MICSLRDHRPDVVADTLTLLVEDDSIGEIIEALSTLGAAMDRAEIYPARTAWIPETSGRAGPAN